MKYYIIAGEASGDMHAANLMLEILKNDPKAQFRFWGGDLMKKCGGELVKHYKDLAFMGFIEVLMNIKTILKNLKFCKKDILNYKPDAIILVDYPGFNLRIAKFAKINNFKVFYYISPTIWAWKTSRVYHIKKYIDRMFCILPFEKDFYEKYNYNADFVGHPLLDEINKPQNNFSKTDFFQNIDKKIIAVLPGSRKQEINKILPQMVSVCDSFSEYQFVIAGVKWQPAQLYEKYLSKGNISIVYGQTYNLLKNSHAAVITSGTATLESVLFDVPQVVCYKTSTISYIIAKKLIKNIKYISLPNLINDKEVVKELIQNLCNKQSIAKELNNILNNEIYKNSMLSEYKQIVEKLGNGTASQKVAQIINNDLFSKK